jgi:beta-glucosidase
MAELRCFPGGFAWGAATSAYQIEGAVDQDGRGASVWDTFSHTPGRVMGGDTGDVACDHYHRYKDDIALMADLGLTAYRFSMAWPRIQPDGRGPMNQRGLDFYRRLLDELAAHSIDAFVTLFHWDLPQPLEDGGGWLSRDTASRFADYAAVVGEAFRDRVALWAPINEPFVHMSEGYGLGRGAPGRTLLYDALPAGHHLLLGHGLAVRALRAAGVSGLIGTVNNLTVVRAASNDPADQAIATLYDDLRNGMFNEPVLRGSYPTGLVALLPDLDQMVHDGDLATIATPLDFLGVNYYNPEVVKASAENPLGFDLVEDEGAAHTAFGWPIVPDGLREILVGLKQRYGQDLPPIYVTENGASFADALDERGEVADGPRIEFLEGHLRAVAEAIEAGVDVRGYFVWSLLDNFEWAAGYSQRFGLVYVDYPTQRRIPKASFRWYRDFIATEKARAAQIGLAR